MPKKQKPPVPTQLQPWLDARRKFGLSHDHVQMARELGLNPKKLGKFDNCYQEPWKLLLPDFIVQQYRKRYGKDRPDTVRSIEEITAAKRTKKMARKAGKSQMAPAQASAQNAANTTPGLSEKAVS